MVIKLISCYAKSVYYCFVMSETFFVSCMSMILFMWDDNFFSSTLNGTVSFPPAVNMGHILFLWMLNWHISPLWLINILRSLSSRATAARKRMLTAVAFWLVNETYIYFFFISLQMVTQFRNNMQNISKGKLKILFLPPSKSQTKLKILLAINYVSTVW